MASRSDSDDCDESLTREQLEELRRNLSLLSPSSVMGLLPLSPQGVRSRAEAERSCNPTAGHCVEDSEELELALTARRFQEFPEIRLTRTRG